MVSTVRSRALGVAVAAVLSGAGCATVGQRIGPPADAKDIEVAFTLSGSGGACTADIAEGDRHTAYPDKRVTWRVTNNCDTQQDVVISFSPFTKDVEIKGIGAGRSKAKSALIRSTQLKKRTTGAYKYDVYVGSGPEPKVDPEIEIDY